MRQVRIPAVRHRQRPVAAAGVAGAGLVVLEALEGRQHICVAPAGIAAVAPAVETDLVAAYERRQVRERRVGGRRGGGQPRQLVLHEHDAQRRILRQPIDRGIRRRVATHDHDVGGTCRRTRRLPSADEPTQGGDAGGGQEVASSERGRHRAHTLPRRGGKSTRRLEGLPTITSGGPANRRSGGHRRLARDVRLTKVWPCCSPRGGLAPAEEES